MTTKTDKVTYQVFSLGCAEPRHYIAEVEAIAVAKTYGEDIDGNPLASVVMHVSSGTHKSKSQVWPIVGTTHSN